MPPSIVESTARSPGSSLGGFGEGEQVRAAVPDILKKQPGFLDTAVDKLGLTGNIAGAVLHQAS